MKKAVKKISDNAVALLAEIGPLIRQHRKSFNITANAAAETAGISRVTLHRIEKGESTVSIGAYLNVISALDLTLNLSARGDARYEADGYSEETLPVRVSLKDYPQLKELAWHVQGVDELSLVEAHSMYERNKRFLDFEILSDRERALIKLLKFAFEGVVF
ncbi:helix-turn-helix domain-containing protein [Pseudomonadales bacterium]|jgi:DNA-binding XRE family transcriptional regulator|nr:helix-turn-helix domain-containing protein [Pseudomonadales bacterium]MDC1444520.1 helix-turn-helix domain-containing protein [bacterium]